MASAAAIIGFFLVLGIIGTIWVFFDAAANSSQSAVLWGLVAFFGGILGILLYVLLGRDGGTDDPRGRARPGGSDREPEEVTHRCQSCGRTYNAPGSDIGSCLDCGGIKVESVR